MVSFFASFILFAAIVPGQRFTVYTIRIRTEVSEGSRDHATTYTQFLAQSSNSRQHPGPKS